MNKQERQTEYREALVKYLEPKAAAMQTLRTRLGLPPADISDRQEIVHAVDYFSHGFRDGSVGFYDKWYEDKKAADAYLAGNYAGRELFTGEFQSIEAL
jgi:hypothetical protein